MMDYGLALTETLRRAVDQFGDKEIVTKLDDGGYRRYTYGDAYERICQLAHALDDYGLNHGDRVSVMATNYYRHYGLYYGPFCSGWSIHMTNHRLSDEHLTTVIDEAEDRVLFFDEASLDTVERIAPEPETIEQYVVLDESVPKTDLDSITDYESFIAGYETEYEWPDLDEDTECGICCTSGTTGLPKGASYFHHGLLLLSMNYGTKDTFGITEKDVILPVVPMFHVNGWCLPYSGTLYGSSFVLPGKYTDLEAVEAMIREQDVTVAATVPTIWADMANYIDEHPEADISTLDRILIDRSLPPPAVTRRFHEEFDTPIIQGYGMTEASSHLVNMLLTEKIRNLPEEKQYELQTKPGLPVPGTEIRLWNEKGEPVGYDGRSNGEIQAQSPWVIDGHFARPEATAESFTNDRWFKTGGVGTIDEYGYFDVVDRVDDIIKNGGGWTSSVELENEVVTHKKVIEAVVIGVEHDRRQERPVVYINTDDDVSEGELKNHLLDRFPKWWLPDELIFIDDTPQISTRKYNKGILRSLSCDRYGSLPLENEAAQ